MLRHFKLLIFLILSLFTLSIICSMHYSFAASDDDSSEPDRSASWYQAQYGTGPFGQNWMIGSFGPDYGIGEQGMRYQYTDPLTGSYVSYSTTGMGMGLGGPLAGYGGMFSPAAAISYGPFAYGNNPQPMPIPGYSTEGYTSGGLFSPNVNYYSAQPSLLGLMGGMFGFGGLYGGLYGGLGYGSGFGSWGGGFGSLFGGWGSPFFGGGWW